MFQIKIRINLESNSAANLYTLQNEKRYSCSAQEHAILMMPPLHCGRVKVGRGREWERARGCILCAHLQGVAITGGLAPTTKITEISRRIVFVAEQSVIHSNLVRSLFLVSRNASISHIRPIETPGTEAFGHSAGAEVILRGILFFAKCFVTQFNT